MSYTFYEFIYNIGIVHISYIIEHTNSRQQHGEQKYIKNRTQIIDEKNGR